MSPIHTRLFKNSPVIEILGFIIAPNKFAEARLLLPFDLEEADGIVVEDVALFLF